MTDYLHLYHGKKKLQIPENTLVAYKHYKKFLPLE
jgi:hypothetical protein